MSNLSDQNFIAGKFASENLAKNDANDFIIHNSALKERLDKKRISHYARMLKAADFAVLIVSAHLVHFLHLGFLTSIFQSSYFFITANIVVAYETFYTPNRRKDRVTYFAKSDYCKLLFCITAISSFVMAFGVLTGLIKYTFGEQLASTITLTILLLSVNRLWIRMLVNKAIRENRISESVLIVGANEQAYRIIDTIVKSPLLGFKIIGIIDDCLEKNFSSGPNKNIIGSPHQLSEIVDTYLVDRIFITQSWLKTVKSKSTIQQMQHLPVQMDLVPDELIMQFTLQNMERIGNVPILKLSENFIEKQNGLLKRIEELIISTALILLLSPIFLFIAIAVKLDSKGPAIFKQLRHGHKNKTFQVYKFRSMVFEEDGSDDIKQATCRDCRVTRVGKWLRRLSLDELPQFFNVLMGDMSIVGPRPHAVQHNLKYGSLISNYFSRHNVRPGITGWAQINGLRGETDTVEKMACRLDADLHYIENWSLLLDVKIVIKTAACVWFQKEAY